MPENPCSCDGCARVAAQSWRAQRLTQTEDPRLFALRAALTRLRVHLDQAVTDVDAAIAAEHGLDDTRINDEASHA